MATVPHNDRGMMVIDYSEERPAVSAYLVAADASRAIDFYCELFGVTTQNRMEMPDGKIGHCELVFGPSLVMIADEFPDMEIYGPHHFGGTPVSLTVYVDDVDAVFAAALAAGATAKRPPEDQFYGDRAGQFQDPFGHVWTIATHLEDLTEDELRRRMSEMFE